MVDRVVLSYKNTLLRQSDVGLLQPTQWLNDRVIGFWFEYLEAEVVAEHDSVCLVGPEVAQFIKLVPKEESSMFTESLNLISKSLILLPVNDSAAVDSYDSAGGSHWSLLVYNSLEKQFYHLDSMVRGGNIDDARKIASNLGLGTERLVELACTQQDNCWDCGIFVCCHAEMALRHYLENGKETKSLPALDPAAARRQRSLMLKTISELSPDNRM